MPKMVSIDKTQKQIANSMNPIIKRQEKIGKYIIELNNIEKYFMKWTWMTWKKEEIQKFNLQKFSFF